MKEQRRGLGDHPRRRSRSGSARPDRNTKPGSILHIEGQQNVSRGQRPRHSAGRRFEGRFGAPRHGRGRSLRDRKRATSDWAKGSAQPAVSRWPSCGGPAYVPFRGATLPVRHSLQNRDRPMTPAMKSRNRGQSNTPAPMINHCAQIETLPMTRCPRRDSAMAKPLPQPFVDQVI
jgi:hypothetical protein